MVRWKNNSYKHTHRRFTLEPMAVCTDAATPDFLNEEWVKGNEIHKHLCVVYGGDAMDRVNVYKWICFFNGGRMEWSGQPSDAVNEETVFIVQALMAEDWRFTLTDLYHEIATRYSYVKVGWTSIRNILQNEHGMCKVSARWVLHQLTEEHRA